MKEAMLILIILLAYGLVGRMDYDDEVRREAEMAAYTRALAHCASGDAP
jgi:hypothetical protein